MEQLLSKAGGWFALGIAALLAAAFAVDQGYAVHMSIVGGVALLLSVLTMRGGDYGAIARGALKMPVDLGHYDDDPIRWSSGALPAF